MGIWNELEIYEIATVVLCLVVCVAAFVLLMLMERDRKKHFNKTFVQGIDSKQIQEELYKIGDAFKVPRPTDEKVGSDHATK